MANPLTKLVAAIVFIAGTSSLTTGASGTPLANGPAIKNAVPARRGDRTVATRMGVPRRMGLGRCRGGICCGCGDRRRTRLALLWL
jgi:hypothetical protein